jgi:hypothetical protein
VAVRLQQSSLLRGYQVVMEVRFGDDAVLVVGPPGGVFGCLPGEVVLCSGAVVVRPGCLASAGEFILRGLRSEVGRGVGDFVLGAGLGDPVEPGGRLGVLGGNRLELAGVGVPVGGAGEDGVAAGLLGGLVPPSLRFVDGRGCDGSGTSGGLDADQQPAVAHFGFGSAFLGHAGGGVGLVPGGALLRAGHPRAATHGHAGGVPARGLPLGDDDAGALRPRGRAIGSLGTGPSALIAHAGGCAATC